MNSGGLTNAGTAEIELVFEGLPALLGFPKITAAIIRVISDDVEERTVQLRQHESHLSGEVSG